MTDKAYIVANKEQELDVLKKYALIENRTITLSSIEQLDGGMIVYDGRKEGKMDKKYKVTQLFMSELNQWRDMNNLDALKGNFQNTFGPADFKFMPDVVSKWRLEDENPIERNNRLITIIRWLNGEGVFEVEKPHKFVVRNDTPDEDGDYYYVQNYDGMTERVFSLFRATKFATREEAQEWANSHQVIVEIDEDENEVE